MNRLKRANLLIVTRVLNNVITTETLS